MAAADEVQESCNTSSGIKLFGATISVTERSKNSDHDHDEEESKKDDGRTVEKRPDKIIPCPRCRSMETKFCYFNNYNVKQPRHFCKGCQRYWTAGGALRNVPVGAGRRKIKPTCRGLEEYEASAGVQQLDFYRVEEHGVFGHLFPAKRRRCATDN